MNAPRKFSVGKRRKEKIKKENKRALSYLGFSRHHRMKLHDLTHTETFF